MTGLKLEDQYADAYDAWKSEPSPQTRAELLNRVKPTISKAVYSYGGSKPSPGVQSQARLMALKAFETYDPAKAPLNTHLLAQMRGLQRYAARNQQIISIPERLSLARRDLTAAEQRLEDDLGRSPSDLEIADDLGLSLKQLDRIRSVRPAVNTGSIMDEEGESYSPPSLRPGAERPQSEIWRNLIYYDLGDVDRVIMDYTLGWHGVPVLSNREIANRLGITEGAVSQRKARIQAMLDEQYEVQ